MELWKERQTQCSYNKHVILREGFTHTHRLFVIQHYCRFYPPHMYHLGLLEEDGLSHHNGLLIFVPPVSSHTSKWISHMSAQFAFQFSPSFTTRVLCVEHELLYHFQEVVEEEEGSNCNKVSMWSISPSQSCRFPQESHGQFVLLPTGKLC